MIEINNGKTVVVHEIGLITNISKFRNPQTGQEMFNISITTNGGMTNFPITKELFEQWLIGLNTCINDLTSKIVAPHLVPRNQIS